MKQKEKEHLESRNISYVNLKKTKSEHGVTIMALVITIIVLLILAGITIQMALDDNGIIKRAKDAKNTYESSREAEQVALGQASNSIQDAMNSTGETGGSGGTGGSSSSGGGTSGNPDNLQEQIDKLRQENEELKRENEELKSQQATGNATPEQVLAGATFSTAAKIGQTGTMPANDGSDNVKDDKAWIYNNKVYFGIPYGYYPSNKYGELENVSERYITFSSLSNIIGLTNDKLAVGQNVLGIDGAFTSDGTATADNIAKGKIAYVNGKKIVGNGAGETNNYNSGYNNGYSAASQSVKSGVISKGYSKWIDWYASGGSLQIDVTVSGYTPIGCGITSWGGGETYGTSLNVSLSGNTVTLSGSAKNNYTQGNVGITVYYLPA